jgi:hypothetical protein
MEVCLEVHAKKTVVCVSSVECRTEFKTDNKSFENVAKLKHLEGH